MTQPVPVTKGLFTLEAGAAARLIGARCGECGRWHFPASAECPYCSATDCVEGALSRRGVLRLFTSVVNRPPGYLGELPFGFGVVELPEGLRLIARLTESNLERLDFGMPVELAIVPLHVDDDGRPVLTYAFAPVAT